VKRFAQYYMDVEKEPSGQLRIRDNETTGGK